MKDTGTTIHGIKVYTDPECPPDTMFLLGGNFKSFLPPRRTGKLVAVTKLYYRDFDKMGRTLIRALRRNHNAVVVYPSGYNIENVLEYLRQHGYPANPRLDKSAQYFMDREIYDINKSNVLMSRIIKQGQMWS